MLATIDQVSDRTFDFVVAGGGTAGLVLAVRLSEDPSVSVLVLEAGSANFQDEAILTPALFGSHFGNPKYDWAFNTVPQDYCGGRSVNWPRGKGLGGSSGINFFQYHRATKSDIDAFETLGNPGWNWDLLKKYYIKSERFIEPKVKTESMSYDLNEHGTNGPLAVGYPVTMSNFEKPYHETLQNLGISRAKEPFSGDITGTWLTPVSINPITRVRSYAANMYYEPNASRSNLIVLVSAQVTKIIMKKQGGSVTATGVTFVQDGKTYQANVTKEVILSTGCAHQIPDLFIFTYQNPDTQILELSGIGSKDVLKKAGVEVLVDLPGVGNNVQEHLACGASYEVRKDKEDDFITFDCLRDPDERAKQIELFKTEGKGVFGMSAICMTFVPLSGISPDAKSLLYDLKESIAAGIRADKYSPALKKQFNIQLSHIDAQEPTCEMVLSPMFNPKSSPLKPETKHITLISLLNHPFSRGSIHIGSKNALEPPTIDPRYFEEEYDIRSLVEIFKFNRRLVQQEPLKSILTGHELNPGPHVQTDEQITEHLKANFNTTFHTIGSCSMLPLKDGGVVDTKLKVYNTTNIRVVDISILPLHISAHTQATAYALGELGADIIKGKV